jgi:hypothetical protein
MVWTVPCQMSASPRRGLWQWRRRSTDFLTCLMVDDVVMPLVVPEPSAVPVQAPSKVQCPPSGERGVLDSDEDFLVEPVCTCSYFVTFLNN